MHNAPTINAQNIDDNECFNWCLVQYLHPADHHLARIRKVDKKKKKILKTQNIPSKLEIVTKLKKRIVSALVISFLKARKGEESKRYYVLIKDFNTLMYDHTLHRGRKHFCCYCLQAFSTAEILKSYVNHCFKISGKE